MPILDCLESVDAALDEEFLLRAVTDRDFRNEILENPRAFADRAVLEKLLKLDNKIFEDGSLKDKDKILPMPVQPQDMSFVELVKEAPDITACANTCVTGFTIICDGQSVQNSTGCRCTCISGYTVMCDGRTL